MSSVVLSDVLSDNKVDKKEPTEAIAGNDHSPLPVLRFMPSQSSAGSPDLKIPTDNEIAKNSNQLKIEEAKITHEEMFKASIALHEIRCGRLNERGNEFTFTDVENKIIEIRHRFKAYTLRMKQLQGKTEEWRENISILYTRDLSRSTFFFVAPFNLDQNEYEVVFVARNPLRRSGTRVRETAVISGAEVKLLSNAFDSTKLEYIKDKYGTPAQFLDHFTQWCQDRSDRELGAITSLADKPNASITKP